MSVNLKSLSDQTIVITGASSGIGLATARRAAKEGANVVLASRNEEALREVVQEIESAGGRAAFCAVDIGDHDAAEKIGKVAEERFGGFDTWVNNAAAAAYARLDEMSIEEHRQLFDTGYFGTVQASLYAARKLRGRGGALINIGSILSERAIPIQGAYSAMKHAVAGFTEALRMELEDEDAGISVTLIKPAGIDTPYPEHARNKMDDPARIPPPLYDPQLVAKAICFAAEHPRRSLTVGGGGVMIEKLGNWAPRLSDKVMELMMTEKGQTTQTPPAPGTADNLYEARKDGREHSNQDNFVRKNSLALEAQLHPVRTGLLLGTIAVAAASLTGRLRGSGRSSSEHETSGRRSGGYGYAERRGARAHQADGTNSSRQYAAGIADENMIPEQGTPKTV